MRTDSRAVLGGPADRSRSTEVLVLHAQDAGDPDSADAPGGSAHHRPSAAGATDQYITSRMSSHAYGRLAAFADNDQGPVPALGAQRRCPLTDHPAPCIAASSPLRGSSRSRRSPRCHRPAMHRPAALKTVPPRSRPGVIRREARVRVPHAVTDHSRASGLARPRPQAGLASREPTCSSDLVVPAPPPRARSPRGPSPIEVGTRSGTQNLMLKLSRCFPTYGGGWCFRGWQMSRFGMPAGPPALTVSSKLGRRLIDRRSRTS